MNKRITRKPANRYHHGDLRVALVQAGLELLRKQGIEGLSLRAVARRVGVSQTAPYAHFADKNTLLAAITAEGNRMLAALMKRGAASSEDPREQAAAMARGYVGFACDEPALFKLMTSPAALEGMQSEEGAAAYAEGIMALTQVIARITGSDLASPQTGAGVIAAWAIVHGLAHLLIDRQVAPQMIGLADREALVTLIASFVRPPGVP